MYLSGVAIVGLVVLVWWWIGSAKADAARTAATTVAVESDRLISEAGSQIAEMADALTKVVIAHWIAAERTARQLRLLGYELSEDEALVRAAKGHAHRYLTLSGQTHFQYAVDGATSASEVLAAALAHEMSETDAYERVGNVAKPQLRERPVHQPRSHTRPPSLPVDHNEAVGVQSGHGAGEDRSTALELAELIKGRSIDPRKP